MSEIPSDLHYTSEHEWVQRTGDDTVRVGITDYAQSALGDVVFVQLPDVGAEVAAGDRSARWNRPSRCPTSTRRSPRKSLRSTVIWRATRSWSTPIPTATAGWSNCRSTPTLSAGGLGGLLTPTATAALVTE